MDGSTALHLGPGVHAIDAQAYHADPCAEPSLSSTLARLLLNRSPLHAWTACARLNPEWEPNDRKTFDIGRAAHRAVLGRGGDYLAYPPELLAANGAASTKAAKEWADGVRASGGTPLKADEVDQIGAMADAVQRQLAAMRITFDPARSELTAIAEIDGVMCRAMLDNAPADPRQPIYDLKSTEDASPDAVIRSVMAYGYDTQAQHYREVWEAATGERRRFRFVFVEKAAPYGVSAVELHDDPASDADWYLDAASKTREARRIWGECLSSGVWPGYPARVALIGAPGFYRQRWADKAVGALAPTSETLAAAMAWQAPQGDK